MSIWNELQLFRVIFKMISVFVSYINFCTLSRYLNLCQLKKQLLKSKFQYLSSHDKSFHPKIILLLMEQGCVNCFQHWMNVLGDKNFFKAENAEILKLTILCISIFSEN